MSRDALGSNRNLFTVSHICLNRSRDLWACVIENQAKRFNKI